MKVFISWRMAIVLLMGFASGIPLALVGSTLQAWMASEKIDLGLIGLYSLVGLPYAWKFVWAPVMDRYTPRFLGRRRGWLLVAQLALIVSLIALSFTNPSINPFLVALFALFTAFFSASQDIMVDAYRTEILKPEEYGAGSGLAVLGYRIAMIVSGALSLILADHIPWQYVYLIMAAILGIGVLTTLAAPEPPLHGKPPISLREAVAEPFLEYFQRKGSIEILLFMILYKLDVFLTMALTTPFMLEMGFSKTDIGAVTKAFGIIATILGTLLGGALMVRLKIIRALWIFGIAQALAGFSYMVLAHLGHHYPAMVIAVTIENLCSGMGIAAFSAFMMSLCNRKFTATQYALFTSLMAFSRYFANAPSGFLAKAVGWEAYFFICVVAGIPGLLLLFRHKKWALS